MTAVLTPKNPRRAMINLITPPIHEGDVGDEENNVQFLLVGTKKNKGRAVKRFLKKWGIETPEMPHTEISGVLYSPKNKTSAEISHPFTYLEANPWCIRSIRYEVGSLMLIENHGWHYGTLNFPQQKWLLSGMSQGEFVETPVSLDDILDWARETADPTRKCNTAKDSTIYRMGLLHRYEACCLFNELLQERFTPEEKERYTGIGRRMLIKEDARLPIFSIEKVAGKTDVEKSYQNPLKKMGIFIAGTDAFTRSHLLYQDYVSLNMAEILLCAAVSLFFGMAKDPEDVMYSTSLCGAALGDCFYRWHRGSPKKMSSGIIDGLYEFIKKNTLPK